MSLQPRLTRLALSLLLALGATAGPPAWADNPQVPFKASVITQETLGFDPARCPSILVGSTTGKGTASHLGAVTLAASDCPVTPDGLNFYFSDGRLTLTAANGDKLTATYSGTLLPVPGSNPVLHAIKGMLSK